jgi:small subunit ribosomal protein S4e
MTKHLKRLRAPAFWKVNKKETKWIARPKPGPHKVFESIPLIVIVRDILGIVETSRDGKKILNGREVLVDGKPRREEKYGVGLMDSISIPKIGKSYRILPGKKGLEVVEVTKADAEKKICRIENKTILGKGRVQLNCHDGRNIIATDGAKYASGDSILIELPSQKILEHVKLEKGGIALITKGRNAGMVADIKKISPATAKEDAKVGCAVAGEKKEVDVGREYIFVMGRDKPLISVSK